MKLTKEPYTPRTHQVYWCNCCDARQVDSEKPETGSFFVQSGHAYNQKTGEYDGEYQMVMFALCLNCLE